MMLRLSDEEAAISRQTNFYKKIRSLNQLLLFSRRGWRF
jgi:hypothetical protein